MRSAFDYAVLRIVPRVERGEFVNAGVVVFCPERAFLGCRTAVDPERLRALWPDVDLDGIRRHVEALPKVAEGHPDGGPIAQLNRRQRFHWLVAPRSTIIQVSPVHTGLCEDPATVLDELFRSMVLVTSPPSTVPSGPPSDTSSTASVPEARTS